MSPVLRGRDICYLTLHTPAKFTKNSHHSIPQIRLLLQGQTGLEADTRRLSVERWIPRDKKMQGLLTWQAQTRYRKWHSAITPKFPLWRCREHLHSIGKLWLDSVEFCVGVLLTWSHLSVSFLFYHSGVSNFHQLSLRPLLDFSFLPQLSTVHQVTAGELSNLSCEVPSFALSSGYWSHPQKCPKKSFWSHSSPWVEITIFSFIFITMHSTVRVK